MDVTNVASWESEDTSIASSNGNGKFTGISNGITRVKATYGSLWSYAPLFVGPGGGGGGSVDLKINGKDYLTGSNKIVIPYVNSLNNIPIPLNISWTSSGFTQCSAVTPQDSQGNKIGGFNWGNIFSTIDPKSINSGTYQDAVYPSKISEDTIYNFKINCQ
jgi:hypothetical protein